MVIESLPGVWASQYLAKKNKMNWGSYGCLKIVALGSHKQHSSVFLILIRSYIKSGCAAITDPKQPWADVGLTEAKRIYGCGKKKLRIMFMESSPLQKTLALRCYVWSAQHVIGFLFFAVNINSISRLLKKSFEALIKVYIKKVNIC